MSANLDPPESAPRRRAAALLNRRLTAVVLGGLILFLIAWFATDRSWVLQQRALARLAVLNARVGAAQAIEDDLVRRVGGYLSAESAVVDAYEDWDDEQTLRDTIASADKVLDDWAAREETLTLQMRTRFGQDEVQAAFTSLLTALDTLSDDVDGLREFGDDSSNEQEDAVDRCRDDAADVEDALANLTQAMGRYLNTLAFQTPAS
jgi:methyl-accepting chemotaxis protein